MKKIYIIPSLEVTRIEGQRILAGSLALNPTESASVTGSGDDVEYENSLSRGFASWDDDDDFVDF